MNNIFVNISKYVIMFCMLFYCYLSFRLGSINKEITKKYKYAIQNFFMLFIFISCFGIIIYNQQKASTIVFFILEFIYLLTLVLLYKVVWPDSSRVLLNNMAMLLSIGFIMVERLAPKNAFKQFLIVIIGTIIAFIIPLIIKKRRFHMKMKYAYAFTGIVLLGITIVLGKTSYGANLSFTIAGVTFQPSEFVKLIYVIFIASMLSKARDFKNIFISAVFAAIHVILLVLSTDLGGALIYFIVYILMLYVATGKIGYFLSGIIAGSAASVISYKLFSHVRTRVTAWLDPWSIIDGKGYQITQSLFAIGTGGWFGMGLYCGLPTKIPVVVKDFVFSAIAEELGLITAICIILICFSCFIIMMKYASKCRDFFYKLILTGFAVMYIFQCFLTIGGVTKFIPSTGVTLPFVSYGGSSILSSLIMFSIVQGCIILINENEESEDERRGREEREKTEEAEEIIKQIQF